MVPNIDRYRVGAVPKLKVPDVFGAGSSFHGCVSKRFFVNGLGWDGPRCFFRPNKAQVPKELVTMVQDT